MVSYTFTFGLCFVIPLVNYCADELTPITSHHVSYEMLNKPNRQFLIEETRDISTWSSCCKRNPSFTENMAQLTFADDSYATCCCTLIGIQQTLYSCGCRCEHPCTYTAAAGGIIDATALGLCIAACTGTVAFKAAIWSAFFMGVPCGAITCCAMYGTYKRYSSSNEDQLDYITDPNNWQQSLESSDDDYEYQDS